MPITKTIKLAPANNQLTNEFSSEDLDLQKNIYKIYK